MNSNLIQIENTSSGINGNENIYNNKYTKVKKLGFGAFGTVFKVKDETNGLFFAMKKFYMDNLKNEKTNFVKKQFDMIASISHTNIIEVKDYFIHKENYCITFPFYEKDLLKIITNKIFTYSEDFIKAVMTQILEGVAFLHEKQIIHRDLKPENILVSEEGVLKITDFDLTRVLSHDQPMSKGVVTIYYRAPEIFYGDTKYNLSVDMWAVGCILAELVLKEPIFKGRNEIDVLFKIHEVLGSPNEENWPQCTQLQNFISFGDNKPSRPLEELICGKVSESLLDLLKNLLVYDPTKRLNAKEALNHPFFIGIENSSDKVKSDLNNF